MSSAEAVEIVHQMMDDREREMMAAQIAANTHRGNAERRDFLMGIVKDVAAAAGVALGWAFIAAGCAVIQ
nr:MAG TPA: Fe-S Cytochrome B6-F complex Fe-S subunit [Caudoviricetes sp.]